MATLDRQRLLGDWIRSIGTGGLGLKDQLDGCLDGLERALEGDRGSESELIDWAALLGRQLGFDRRTASFAQSIGTGLEDALATQVTVPRELLRKLTSVIADGYALGTRREAEEAFLRVLSDSSPVFSLENRCAVGFLIDVEVLDSLVGRLLRTAVGANASTIVIDLGPRVVPNERLIETLSLLTVAREAEHVHKVIITGAAHPDELEKRLREMVHARGGRFEKLKVATTLHEFLLEVAK